MLLSSVNSSNKNDMMRTAVYLTNIEINTMCHFRKFANDRERDREKINYQRMESSVKFFHHHHHHQGQDQQENGWMGNHSSLLTRAVSTWAFLPFLWERRRSAPHPLMMMQLLLPLQLSGML